MKLTTDQSTALNLLKSDRSVFISGKGGTGKTFTIKYFLKTVPKHIPVTTSTGAAAIIAGNGAITTASFFGLGIADSSMDMEKVVQEAMRPNVIKRILATDTVIIDEVSMISGFQFNCILEITKRIRKNLKPMRFILTGDFYQLPPVTKGSNRSDWIFNSQAWKELDLHCFELREVMRTRDIEFLDVLNNVREGVVTEKDVDFFKRHRYNGEEFDATRIFPRVSEVEAYNEEKLMSLPGELIEIPTEFYGEEKEKKNLIKNMPIPKTLRLKIGSYVMIRQNYFDLGVVNGSCGHLLSVTESHVTIKLTTGVEVSLRKHLFTSLNADGKNQASAHNFPICLADSITSHKCQGLSLPRAVISLRGLFAGGMAYVMLSRLSDANGLKIQSFEKKSIFTDPEVKEFYKSIA